MLLTASLFLTMSCKKSDGNTDIFYASVDSDYYTSYGNSYGVDLDMDGEYDFTILEDEFVDTYQDSNGNYVVVTTSSIEFEGNGNIEFATTDDCVDLFYNSEVIDNTLSFEETANLANNYAISCNPTSKGKSFFGFRIKQNDDWHYGWMQINYDLDNGNNNNYYYYDNNITVNIQGWGFNNKKEKSILTGQTE